MTLQCQVVLKKTTHKTRHKKGKILRGSTSIKKFIDINNGNISSTTWQVLGRAKQAYGFKYDDLDRLSESKYFDITDSYNSSNHQWSSSYSTDYKFNESSTYDVRGNILSLQRNGLNGGSWTGNGYTAATYGMIDNLGYIYNGQNQVTKVVDTSLANKGFIYKNASVSTAFTYDTNGNLTSDANKGITSIEYNYLNLPMKIVFNRTYLTSYNNGSIEFIYDATGAKLRKTVKDVNGNVLDTRDYVNGVEYNNGTLSRIAHTEGAVVRNEFNAYEHQYVLRDHLGNTRVTFRDGVNKGDAYIDWTTYTYVDPNAGNTTGLNDGVITSADIMQINNYYPFGLNMEGNWNGAQGGNKYQYNGKEWNDDFGLGWNDYGARFYDPAVSRWLNVDPLAEKMGRHSPYNFCFNNPINHIDYDGNIPWPLKGTQIVVKHTSVYLKNQQVWIKKRGVWESQTGNFEGSTTNEYNSYMKSPNNYTIVRTSNWNTRRKSTEAEPMTSPHIGSDYRAPIGTDVYSLGDGKIVGKPDTKNGVLTVQYGDFKVTFRHLSKINDFKDGDKIYEGQILASSGNTNTIQPHLHAEAVNTITGEGVNVESINAGTVSNEEFFTKYNGDYEKLRDSKTSKNTITPAQMSIDTSDDLVPNSIKNIKNEKGN